MPNVCKEILSLLHVSFKNPAYDISSDKLERVNENIHKFWTGNPKNTGLEIFKIGRGFCRIDTVIAVSNAAHHQYLS